MTGPATGPMTPQVPYLHGRWEPRRVLLHSLLLQLGDVVRRVG